MFWIGKIRSASGVPLCPLVAVCRNASRVLDHPRHVHEIPGHERRVAICEIVFRATRTGIQIRRTRAGLAEPGCVGLGRYHVTQMLQRIEHVHRTMLGPVFVACDQTTADTAIVGVLSVLIEISA